MACSEGTVVQPSVAELAGSSMSGVYVGTADAVLLADFQVNYASQPSPPLPLAAPFVACPTPASPCLWYMYILLYTAQCTLKMLRSPHVHTTHLCHTTVWKKSFTWLVLWKCAPLHASLRRLFMQGRPASPEALSSALQAAQAALSQIIQAQHQLASQHTSTTTNPIANSEGYAGCDPAAAASIIALANPKVAQILSDSTSEKSRVQIDAALGEAKEEVIQQLTQQGVFRFSVRAS